MNILSRLDLAMIEEEYRRYVDIYVTDMLRLDAGEDNDVYADPEEGPAAIQYQHEMLGDLIFNAQAHEMGTIFLSSPAVRSRALDGDEFREMLAGWFEQDCSLDDVLLDLGYTLIQRDVLDQFNSARAALAGQAIAASGIPAPLLPPG